MTVRAYYRSGCLVPGCPGRRATDLGACEPHWRALPADLRERWWLAWHTDARRSEWTPARRAAIEYLTARGD